MAEQLIPVDRQQVIYDKARLPSRDTIRLYLSKMQRYKNNEEFFHTQGFTLPIAEKVIPLAQLSPWDVYYIFYYAKRIPENGTYLEIGSLVGGSLVSVYEATKVIGSSINLIGIELRVQRELLRNTKFIPRLRLIESTSDTAKDQINNSSVDLLFIDGDHSYKAVKKDIENYWPKLKDTGVLLGHDYGSWKYPDVVQAVNEIFGKEGFTVLKNSWMWMAKKEKSEK